MLSAEQELGPGGALSRLLPGFAPRAEQQAMARAVEQAVQSSGVLVCEAGTGTGKTFAYLVPALASGRRVVISTGTKSLQDQLFARDLPLVRKALGGSAPAALLKGRANYLCLYRAENAGRDGQFLSPDLAHQLSLIRQWSRSTRSGDIAEMPDIAEDSPAWRWATSTAENCLGQDCPMLAQCHVLKARREAAEAQVLVINHHLFFADMTLRDEGFGELVPGADLVVLDEAHQLADVAGQFFGISLGSRQLVELARDCTAAHAREAGDVPAIPAATQSLEQQVRELRLALGGEPRRGEWRVVRERPAVRALVDKLALSLKELGAVLEDQAQRGRELQACRRRSLELGERLEQVAGPQPEGRLQWFETFTRAFSLHVTPLEIGEIFGQRMAERDCAWVFTSATLAVDRRFDHFLRRMGIAEAEQAIWDSPFDFQRQALCLVPQGMPDPGAPDYTARVVELAERVLRSSRGRAFVLFTSHRALREAAERLGPRVSYPLLVQGQAPRSRLLERFRETPGAVLLGTSSFWEGVDVRGEALSCVIIDKLPFASPDDPVLRARHAAIREQGGNPFLEQQLPQAVITLKQGVGRLIRDVSDSGALVLCDPRLFSRGYGRVFLDSLPPLPVTRDTAELERFFAARQEAQARPGSAAR